MPSVAATISGSFLLAANCRFRSLFIVAVTLARTDDVRNTLREHLQRAAAPL
jgi:hypothetical protein